MQAITSKADAEHIVLNQAHESILQTLDRVFDGRLYRAEDFVNSQDWDGVPVIFAEEHPDLDAYEKDPKAELDRIKGKLAGQVSKARIESAGHKRLMAVLDLLNDPDIEAGINEGKVSLSTGFWAQMAKEEGIAVTQGPVKPHHVLLFYEDRNNQPRDLGTGILNQSKPEAEEKEIMSETKQEAPDMAPLLQELNAVKVELKGRGEELEQAKAAIVNKDAEIVALKNVLAAKEKAEMDAKWESLKNSYVPPGLVAKPEDEAALRQLMQDDAVGFINKCESVKRDLSAKGESGVTNVAVKKASDAPMKDAEMSERLAKLNIPSITGV